MSIKEEFPDDLTHEEFYYQWSIIDICEYFYKYGHRKVLGDILDHLDAKRKESAAKL